MKKILFILVIFLITACVHTPKDHAYIHVEPLVFIPTTTTSTTTTTIPKPPPTTHNTKPSKAPKEVSRGHATGDAWDCIRQYESGGTTDPAGANLPGEGYYGFTDKTWHTMGGTGQASDHSYEEQTEKAKALQKKSGWGQWSTAKGCGLI